ncbi:alpha/beta fold hydrolase [Plantactinospora mayteni]|uniref:Thioesterase n=1 Tax=Plantactinospora mayteni TaxID=566021 RepID=A0ABQ4EIB0_9ACTN|nr:alpha/beta fold hydrolase [Plantactinospora mayteni]GIG94468.1 thioesterase [Plantactinospora mayteni]
MLSTAWLRRCGGSDRPGLRLICLPYAGAGAAVFREWRLPDELGADVWAVQLPGRESRFREPAPRRVQPVVDALAGELHPLLDRPYALFGHSMGALLAFELCRRLRRDGAPQPVRLLVSAYRAPHLPAWRPAVSTLPQPQLLTRLAEMAGQSRSAVMDPDLLTALTPMLRADFELCETYRYVPDDPLDMLITCFAAVDDPEVRVDEMLGWQRHSTMDSQLHPYSGGHLFLLDHRASVLSRIAMELAPLSGAGRRGTT